MKKVLLGMSGGVDSSVSALLLKQKGYKVIGATMELFSGSCCNIDTNMDAKNVCNLIGIPHFTFNYKEEFKKYVINDFIDCYSQCKTPNPCIECNRYLKFGKMYEKAQEMGCEYIATGHYAKTEYSEKYQRWVLKKSNSLKKDQSYVLWNIPKELIGQRKGLGISNPVPLFVLGFNEEKNEVIVGEEKELYKKEVLVDSINLLLMDKITEWIEVEVKTRYSTKSAKAKIIQEENKIRIVFEEPQRAITPGQSAVFYKDDIVVGGGKII